MGRDLVALEPTLRLGVRHHGVVPGAPLRLAGEIAGLFEQLRASDSDTVVADRLSGPGASQDSVEIDIWCRDDLECAELRRFDEGDGTLGGDDDDHGGALLGNTPSPGRSMSSSRVNPMI